MINQPKGRKNEDLHSLDITLVDKISDFQYTVCKLQQMFLYC